MPEWWTYTLSDFLLFSPRTYYRLIERHNEALWPAQVAAFGLGFVIVGLLRRPSARQGRIMSTILAIHAGQSWPCRSSGASSAGPPCWRWGRRRRGCC